MKRRRISTPHIAAAMALLTMGSKVLGFVREAVLANYYGAGMVTDAYNIALSIPNYLLAAFVSAVATAYMPVLAERSEKLGAAQANLFTSRLITLLLLISCSVTVLGIVFSDRLVRIFAPGFGNEALAMASYYLKAAFLIVIFNIFISVCGAYMRFKGVFLPELIFGLTYDIFIIAAIFLSAAFGSRLLIYGVVAGYVSRGIFALAYSRRCGFRYIPDFSFGPAVRSVVAMAVPIFAGGYVAQINTMVDRLLASTLTEGSISALQYGNLIVGVIIAVTTTIITTIIYPRLNRAFARQDMERIGELCARSMDLGLLISLPFMLGSICFAAPVVSVLYERGAFGASAAAMTSSAFLFYSIRIPFAAAGAVIVNALYSLRDMKTPVRCSIVSVVFNIVMNLILIVPMKHSGLALATGLASAVYAGLLYLAFNKKYPELRIIRSWKKIALMGMFSVLSVGTAFGFWKLFGYFGVRNFVTLMLAILPACGIYLILVKLAGFEELGLLKQLFNISAPDARDEE